ncbi:hypothetical protein [Capnocytophaga catalasegens]|uniref:Uncharacterized protein n=1 Tax=Capnocytophaga catalasegens TaxID=1004260 RepID=A0AAV5AXP7_9FLAO|nr:hypothetical protein [Capnocytophaga catalasegens]GIZ15556.1 hypothetical protein RCZ03_15560 [Capnocytophaga catalasegens]GJM50155.1 hypothetical protein RCZ15_11290 [Capnocytophaga catalasegens]GJM52082.1 hypothetical protein RCZ16_04000 [Capnocytophaga catalasegens]
MTEQQIGRKAAQMLESSLRGKMSQFSAHISRGDKESIREVKGTYQTRLYGGKNFPKIRYLRKISIKMEQHGFVQHYGVDTLRAGSERTRTKPRSFTYRYKVHKMRMTAKPFIDKAVEQSGVVPFVLENITKIRNEQVFAHLKSWLEK